MRIALCGFMGLASLSTLFCAPISESPNPAAAQPPALRRMIARLRPLHHPKGKPGPGDWLSIHPESGQTFREYLVAGPIRPTGVRSILYIQPVGSFTPEQRQILELTQGFLEAYFNLPVRVLPSVELTQIPPQARRIHPAWGTPQILTTYILDEVLKPGLPKDAAASLALTASDLWPRDGWNFVFGQARLQDRVGIWSIARFGNPSQGPEAFRRCLLRTLKTASHETGHIFSLLHCTRYECNMNGSETLEEGDREPLELCPECMAKLCWATGTPPSRHLETLAQFCAMHGFDEEKAHYLAALERLNTPTRKGASRQ